MKRVTCVAIVIFVAAAASVSAEDLAAGLELRGGIGTDITFGGVAFGAGVNKLFLTNLEAGLVFYYGSFKETSNNGSNDYTDTTKVTAFAVFLNYLYGYHPDKGGFYLVGGVGLAYLGVNWEETSPTDTTLGTPLPGGGSKQTFDGSTGGTLFNLGVGYALAGGLDLRFEVPVVVAFGNTGGASTVIPLFTLTGGYRFGP
jgi:hypothetical protein